MTNGTISDVTFSTDFLADPGEQRNCFRPWLQNVENPTPTCLISITLVVPPTRTTWLMSELASLQLVNSSEIGANRSLTTCRKEGLGKVFS